MRVENEVEERERRGREPLNLENSSAIKLVGEERAPKDRPRET